MRRLLALAAIVVLTLVVAWLVHGYTNDGRTLPAPSTEREGVAPASISEPEQALGPEIARTELMVAPSDAEPAAEAPASERILIRVLDALDGKPIPHAEVLLLDPAKDDLDAFRAAWAEVNDFERALMIGGRILPTDEGGEVSIPRPPGWIHLAARAEKRFGVALGAATSTLGAEIEIRVAPVIHVRVHVEDEIGTPLEGVPVGYLVGDGLDAGLRNRSLTDAQGDAEIRHLETSIKDYERSQRNRIAAMLPFQPLPGVDFRPDAPPEDVVQLVVPRMGSVLVEVLDFAGERVGDGIPIRLQRALSREEIAAWKERHGSAAGPSIRDGLGSQQVTTVAGLARFAHVPIGIRFECFGSLDRSGVQEAMESDGPLRPGEEVHVVLRQSAAHPLLRVRLVDVGGAALSKERLSGSFWRGWPRRAGTTEAGQVYALDEDGRFERRLAEGTVPPGTARIYSFLRATAGESRLEMAWLFLPERLPDSGFEAGNLIIGGPLALAGRVERPDGAPVAGARLYLHARIAPPGAADDGSYSRVIRSGWSSGQDGSFALTGALPGNHHHLEAWPPDGGKAVYLPFEVGDADLRVVIQESGSIRGKLLLDEGIPGSLFLMEIGRTAPQVSGEMHSAMARVDALSGEFDSGAVTPGTWMVAVRSRATNQYLARIDGIEVSADAPADDPRLQIDLRGKVFRHVITVLDADGDRPQQLSLVLEHATGWSYGNSTNPADVCSTERVLHGIVSAPGWGDAEFHSAGGETELRLSRGVPVRIELSGDGLPPASEGLSFGVSSEADPALGRPRMIHYSDWLEGDWSVPIVLPTPGRYQVEIHLRSEPMPDRPWGNDVQLRWGAEEYFSFEITRTGGEQVVAVQVTAQQVEEARARARGER